MQLHALPASPTLLKAGTGPTLRLAQWLPCGLAPPLHGSPAAPARPRAPPSHPLHFSNQMAAPICATATGDAHWVRTAGSVSARPAGEGPDATLPWKPPVLITRIMREVSKHLLIPSPSRAEHCVYFHHESFFLKDLPYTIVKRCCNISFEANATEDRRRWASGVPGDKGWRHWGLMLVWILKHTHHRKVAGPWLCLWAPVPA